MMRFSSAGPTCFSIKEHALKLHSQPTCQLEIMRIVWRHNLEMLKNSELHIQLTREGSCEHVTMSWLTCPRIHAFFL